MSFSQLNRPSIQSLDEDSVLEICRYLPHNDVLSFLTSTLGYSSIFANSKSLLRKFPLVVDESNFINISTNVMVYKIPFKNISANFGGSIKIYQLLAFLNNFRFSVENLEMKQLRMQTSEDFYGFFCETMNLQTLVLDSCSIYSSFCKALPLIGTLKHVTFIKCNEHVFEMFNNQSSLETITVRNDDSTWNGFPHEIFNNLVKNIPKLRCIELIGPGTGSYFDYDEFPYHIEVLKTTMITYNWYVGITTARLNFLESQIGYLKELTIDELPFDFDGGKVLKFIIEKMELQKFYYRKSALIANWQKQEVKKFEASETQIQALYEMFRQFKTIRTLQLNLSAIDIASDEIEKIINPRTALLHSLREFILIDDSAFRGTFGVFLGLYKNLKFITKLSFMTLDRNINILLQECLPEMIHLEELYLTSTATRVRERFEIIRKFTPNLKKLSIAKQFLNEAKQFFGRNVEIFGI